MTSTTLRLSKSGKTVALRDQGSGEAVLLIHGVGMQSAAWAPQIDALGKTHRVLAVDMPGHGGSDPLKPEATLPDFVAWCHDLVSILDVGQISIVGHSMGALIAGGFAVEHSNLTSRVCLISGVYKRDKRARDAVVARACDIKAGQTDLDTPLHRWFGDSTIEMAARARVAEWLGAVDQRGYATAYAAFAQGDATYVGRYADIACPFLALTGGDDPNSTPAMSQAMVAHTRNGYAVTIDGHRHMVNLTAPDIVNKQLSVWLSKPTTERGRHSDTA